MGKYILLVNWTDRGIRNIKGSAKRLDAGRALAKEHGCVLENFFMTMGVSTTLQLLMRLTTRALPNRRNPCHVIAGLPRIR